MTRPSHDTTILATERLLLRRWRPSDLAPFAAMNADSRVMEYFLSTLDSRESEALVERIEAHFIEHGFGFWAVEAPSVAGFIGFVGLMVPRFQAHFTPCVEIGWRLAHDYWGRGYASEAARRALSFGIETLGLAEVVSFTAAGNLRSRRVMERIGMFYDANGDFDHPALPEEHALRRHVLHRFTAQSALSSYR